MITRHVLELLKDNGFGTVNQTLWWEQLPSGDAANQVTGIAIISRGAPLEVYGRWRQDFDLFSRGTDDVTGNVELEKVLDFLQNLYNCKLPIIPNLSETLYTQCHFTVLTGTENLGPNDNGRIEWRATIKLTYVKE